MDNNKVRMDARKLLRNFNQSAQSRVAFFEHLVGKMGKNVKKPYVLAALHNDSLVFEDKSTNDLYLADISQEQNRINIVNVRPITVVEEDKNEDFAKNVIGLVNSITFESEKTNKSEAKREIKEAADSADRYWNSLSRQKFRSTVVPNSGYVTTRDGIVRKIKISNNIVPAEAVEKIAKLVAESVKERVEISEGKIVKGVFIEGDAPFSLPINEMTRRRVIARKMHTVAENAYKSKTFCKIVGNVAGLVCEGKVREAVVSAYKFLKEEQEFCLLTSSEMKTLIENALAVNGEFNPLLARDVSRLFSKTNLKANQKDIVEAWSKTAQLANSTSLFESVQDLSTSKNFAYDYQKLLTGFLVEDSSIVRRRGQTYLTCLKLMRSVLSNIESEHKLVEHMDTMITALQSGDVDTATILEAESLIASVDSNLISQISSLEQFDSSSSDPMDLADQESGADAGEPIDLNDDSLGQPGAFDFDGMGAGDTAGMGGLDDGMGSDNSGLDAGGADLGASPEAKSPSLGGRSRPAPGKIPLAASLERSKSVVEGEFTPVEEMTTEQLHEEMLAWQVHGKQFVEEDDDCLDQMDRLINRCSTLGEGTLRKTFESMRESIARNGDPIVIDELEDRYAQYKASHSASINSDYDGVVESKEQGSAGVEKASSVKETDCKSGDKAYAGEGSAPKSMGSMGKDFQGDKGVQAKGVKESPHLAKQTGEFKSVGSKNLPKKDVRVMEGVAMDSPTGKGLVNKGVKGVSGRTGEKFAGEGSAVDMPPGGLGMSEFQGKSGVMGKSTDKSDARSAGKTAGNSGLEGGDKKAPEPTDGVQKKAGKGGSSVAMEKPTGKGLAESKKCPCGHKKSGECKTCKKCSKCCSQTESQYKWGTKRHASGGSGGGRQKGKLAKEDVNISVSGADKNGRAIDFSMSSPDADISGVIDAIVANMGSGDDGMVTEPMAGATPPVGDEPMSDVPDMDMGDDMDAAIPSIGGEDGMDAEMGDMGGEEPPMDAEMGMGDEGGESPMDGGFAGLESEMDAEAGDLDAAEGNIDAAEGNLDSAESELALGDVDGAEQDLEQAESDIGDAKEETDEFDGGESEEESAEEELGIDSEISGDLESAFGDEDSDDEESDSDDEDSDSDDSDSDDEDSDDEDSDDSDSDDEDSDDEDSESEDESDSDDDESEDESDDDKDSE